MTASIDRGTAHRLYENFLTAINSNSRLNVILHSCVVGSTFINGTGNDVDILVYSPLRDTARDLLFSKGFELGGSEGPESGSEHWNSFKKGDVNVLVCYDLDWYERWRAAAQICKLVADGDLDRAMDKEQRILTHMVIMDNLCVKEL